MGMLKKMQQPDAKGAKVAQKAQKNTNAFDFVNCLILI
jgi:hypothetical protein